jgi:hypothetical protein
MAGRAGIETLLEVMGLAFGEPGVEADESQALMQNLASVPAALWRALPAGAARSIEAIVLHVGSCKVMYADHAFHGATLDWADPEVQPWPEGHAPMADTIPWLIDVHRQLVADVTALADDAELDRPRRTNWGETWRTRSIIGALITHDAYHAGEINHVRSLLDGDDRWFFVKQSDG